MRTWFSAETAVRISVLILTSPGREAHLQACLQALKAQSFQDFELIVADDGSAAGQQVAARQCRGWKQPVYLWRANDYCMSRSYNLGAAAATGDFLVLLSADVLLNPRALQSYAVSFAHLPQTVIYGYFGSDKDDLRDSVLVPGRRVNLRDERFAFGPQGKLHCQPQMLTCPQHYAWGGNWGLARSLLIANGMNEAFSGWGLEDVDFANRILQRGGHLAFSLDVWAEHQAHELIVDQDQYQRNRQTLGPYCCILQEPGLIYDPASNPLFKHIGMGTVNS